MDQVDMLEEMKSFLHKAVQAFFINAVETGLQQFTL
jgi:hypothetical protein